MNENIQVTEPQQTNLFDSHVEYIDASKGSRFLNFLIDNLLMRFALSYATSYIVVNILLSVAPNFVNSIAESNGKLLLFSFIVAYFNYLMYYTICEAAFKGYTLGKLITGTRAVRDNGDALTFKDALLRSLSRIVPLEAFSGLGSPCSPWHDTWTKTRVIKAR